MKKELLESLELPPESPFAEAVCEAAFIRSTWATATPESWKVNTTIKKDPFTEGYTSTLVPKMSLCRWLPFDNLRVGFASASGSKVVRTYQGRPVPETLEAVPEVLEGTDALASRASASGSKVVMT